MTHNKIFVVLTHVIPPEHGSRVSKQDIVDGFRLERCEVVTRVTNRHLQEAAYVFDVVKKTIVKSRNPAINYDKIYDYFKRKYPDHNSEILKLLNQEE